DPKGQTHGNGDTDVSHRLRLCRAGGYKSAIEDLDRRGLELTSQSSNGQAPLKIAVSLLLQIDFLLQQGQAYCALGKAARLLLMDGDCRRQRIFPTLQLLLFQLEIGQIPRGNGCGFLPWNLGLIETLNGILQALGFSFQGDDVWVLGTVSLGQVL